MAKTSPDGRFRFVKEADDPSMAGTGYDTEKGMLVSWNVLECRQMSKEVYEAARQRVDVLKSLSHDHVLRVHSSWDVPSANTEQRRKLSWKVGGRGNEGGDGRRSGGGSLVYLTMPCTTLEAFIQKKVGCLRWRVVKRWCIQVLDALSFLHRQPTPIVHNTLNLGNVYIDPATSHLFVGGVEDIVAPSPLPHNSAKLAPYRRSGGTGSGVSWGGRARAWGFVGGNGGAGATSRTSAAVDLAEDGNALGAGKKAGMQDIHAFGTLLIEMFLKKRLDPLLARDDRWVETLLAVSGWPATAIDFVVRCKAPINERPSADQLLEHPFLELGDDLDDEAIRTHTDLVATTQAMIAAAATGETSSVTLPSMGFGTQRSPPSPVVAMLNEAISGAVAVVTAQRGASSYSLPNVGGSAYPYGTTRNHHPSSGPGCYGSGGWANSSLCSDDAPSCVSTEAPSPCSPSAAPSFGGGHMTSFPTPTGDFLAEGTHNDWAGAAESDISLESARMHSKLVNEGPSLSGGCIGVPDTHGIEMPRGVTPTALANATAMAAQINRLVAASKSGCDARGNLGQVRTRPVSCIAVKSTAAAAASSSCSDGGNTDNVGGRNGMTNKGPASEDAVWDMLPSDERECRRPFTCSAVDRRYGGWN